MVVMMMVMMMMMASGGGDDDFFPKCNPNETENIILRYKRPCLRYNDHACENKRSCENIEVHMCI